MADDLDAELLALAGEDSDEETTPQTSKQKPDSLPPSSSPRSPQQLSTMERSKSGKSGRRGRKSRNTDDDEEGELSAAESHHSLQSASMSESDSDASGADVEADTPLFPYDNIYYSAEDKERIMNLPEIEREEILTERNQEVDRHRQNHALRQLLAERHKEATRAEKAKRKASSAGLEDGQRKSSRQKMTLGGRKVGETSGAMAAYKRQREQKGKRDEQRRREPVAKEQKAKARAAGLSDDSAEGESDLSIDRERSPSAPKDDPPADLRDIQRARVGRSNFAQVCFYPGFDEAIAGCYARVNVGVNRQTDENEYRLCLIKRFTEGRPYGMTGSNGRSFATTQYAVLAHGKSEREFPFIACSDSPFTEAEFNRYRTTLAVEECIMPTKPMLARKVADINRLLNHKFTPEELNEKLRKQGTLDNKMLIFKRMETERKLQMARSYGDEEEIAALEEQMKEFAAPKLAFGTTLAKPRPEKKTEQERIAELNLRNQKLNYENVRRAQLEERRAAKKAAAAVARGELAVPFARVHPGSQAADTPVISDPSRDVTPTTGTNSEVRSNGNTPAPTTPSNSQKPSNGTVGTIRYRKNDDEAIADLDIQLDIEI